MNPHRSLFYLTSAPLWKVLTILLCLAGVQLGGAVWLLQEPDILVDTLLDHLLFRWSAAVALALVMAVLLYTTGGYNAGYTMARLRLKSKTQYRWFLFRGVLMFFLCWAVQLGIVLGVCWLYAARQGDIAAGNQFLLLASYCSSYFHGLLPLADIVQWFSTIAIYTMMGIASGMGSYFSFSGKRTLWPPVVCLCSGLGQPMLGDYGWSLLIVMALVLGCFVSLVNQPIDREEAAA